MIGIDDLQQIIADTFLDGNLDLAGIALYILAILATFALTEQNSGFKSLIVGMAVTMFFSIMGVLSTELTILLIIVSVLGLAYTSRAVWRD